MLHLQSWQSETKQRLTPALPACLFPNKLGEINHQSLLLEDRQCTLRSRAREDAEPWGLGAAPHLPLNKSLRGMLVLWQDKVRSFCYTDLQ